MEFIGEGNFNISSNMILYYSVFFFLTMVTYVKNKTFVFKTKSYK